MYGVYDLGVVDLGVDDGTGAIGLKSLSIRVRRIGRSGAAMKNEKEN